MRTIFRFAFICLLLPALLPDCADDNNYLPGHFYGLTLQRKLSGQDAREYVDRLHFNPVALRHSEIGSYVGENGPATVYIAHYNTREEALAAGRRMTRKISPQNSVFTMGSYLTIGGRQVYRCFGMGQTHYVFARKNALFWVSVNTVKAQEILSAYLAYLSSV